MCYLVIRNKSGYGIIHLASFSTPSGTRYYCSVKYTVYHKILTTHTHTHTERERERERERDKEKGKEARESENEKDQIIPPPPSLYIPIPGFLFLLLIISSLPVLLLLARDLGPVFQPVIVVPC